MFLYKHSTSSFLLASNQEFPKADYYSEKNQLLSWTDPGSNFCSTTLCKLHNLFAPQFHHLRNEMLDNIWLMGSLWRLIDWVKQNPLMSLPQFLACRVFSDGSFLLPTALYQFWIPKDLPHIHTNRHYYGAQPEFATSSDRSFIFSFTQHIFIEQN